MQSSLLFRRTVFVRAAQQFKPVPGQDLDLSVEKRPGPHAEQEDIFAKLHIDPIKEYKNIPLLSRFVTDTGMIQPRTETGLSWKNQRKVSKAIRRAKAIGLMPYTYRLRFQQ